MVVVSELASLMLHCNANNLIRPESVGQGGGPQRLRCTQAAPGRRPVGSWIPNGLSHSLPQQLGCWLRRYRHSLLIGRLHAPPRLAE